MNKKILKISLVFFLLISLLLGVAIVHFKNVSILLGASLMHTNPPLCYVADIRKTLLGQEAFQKMLKQHEMAALARFSSSGDASYTKRHIYRLPITMFDMPFFQDDWATWVRTDIVNGHTETAFLIRLGIEKDVNAARFFGRQCQSKIGRNILQFLMNFYNQLFDWGVLKPYRINITESDKTSSIGPRMLSLKKWHAMVEEMHKGKHAL